MEGEEAAPEAPALGDQASDQPKPEGSQSPEGSDQTAESLYSEEEIKGLSPEAEKRVKGMQSRFTKVTQEAAEEKRQLAAERASLQDTLAELRRERESLRQPSAPETPATQSRLEKALAQYPERDRETMRTIYEEAVAEAARKVAPVTEEARLNAAWVSGEARHTDFNSVMTERNVNAVMARNPGLRDPEAVYKIIKHDILAGEVNRKGEELNKYQAQAKRQAQTEVPSGPTSEAEDSDWYDKLPKAERKKLTLTQLAEKSQRHQRAQGR